jgi:hypothetical protein
LVTCVVVIPVSCFFVLLPSFRGWLVLMNICYAPLALICVVE